MTGTSRTKANDPDDPPIFTEPIPVDIPRRQFDRKLLEGYDADHKRIREMSGRLTRIEVGSESFARDITRIDEKLRNLLVTSEKTADSLTQIVNSFAIHTQMEEHQWDVVNDAHKTLTHIGTVLNQHLQESAATNVRLGWLEKTTWALWGVVGAAGAALVPFALMGMRGG